MIEFRLLGSLDLTGSDGQTLRPILAQPKRIALLAYLAVATPRGFHRRDRLLGLFWPDSDAEHARGSLRTALYYLRQSLGDRVVMSRGEEEVGLAAGEVFCDVVAYEEALERGEPEKAIELYRGDLLDGFHVSGMPEFERWIESERQRLFDACAGALERLAEEAEAAGDHRRAVDWWKRAILHDPYNSRYALRLMEALAAAGDRGNALQFAQEHRRRLSEELGMEPDAELLALAERLRRDWGQEGEPLGKETRTDIDEDRSASQVAPVSWLTWRRGLGIGTLAVAFAIVIVAVVREIGGPDTGEAVSSSRVAVLPFTVRGADDLTYLGEGMVDLMSTALDGAGELQAIDPYALLNFLKRTEEVTGPEEAGRVARHFGAGLYVLGSIVAAGDQIQVIATLYDVDESVVRRAEARIDNESQLFNAVDDISRQLLPVGSGGPGTRLGQLAALTTNSLPALKEYLLGENEYRAGRFASAVAAFKRAVAADSTFALGFYRLAVAGDFAGALPDSDQLEAIQRALRYKERLADQDRALLEAHAAYLRGAAGEAERRFRSIVWSYPSDVDAWLALNRVLAIYSPVLVRPVSQRRAALERILELDPDHIATFGLAMVAAQEGKFDEARALLQRWLELKPDADLALARRAALVYARDDRAEQERVLAELRGASARVWRVAFRSVAGEADNRSGAIEIATLWTEPSRASAIQAIGHSYIAMTHLALGRWEAAKAELDWAEPPDVPPQWSALATRVTLGVSPFLPLPRRELEELRNSLAQLDSSSTWVRVTRPYLAGLLSVRLEDYDAAERYAGELEAHAADPDTGRLAAEWAALAQDWALSVRAHAAWKAGRSREALALLNQTEPESWFRALGDSPLFLGFRAPELYLGAELFRELGREEEALIWYGSLVATGLLNEVYLVPSHYRRAEIYERLGNLDEAARHYRRVIEIWKDADPELQPWVEAARRAMEALSPDR